MVTNEQPDLNLIAKALRLAELHEQLATDYELELVRAKELVGRIYLQEMPTASALQPPNIAR